MKKLLTFLFLLLACPAYAQYVVRTNCDTGVTPQDNSTVCLQSTTVASRTQGHMYIRRGGAWVDPEATAAGAPTSATYVTQTPNGVLTAEQALSALGTGLLKNTTGTGVLSIAIQGTDYYAPGGTDVAVADGGTGRSTLAAHGVLIGAATAGVNVTSPGTAGQVLTSQGALADPIFATPGVGGTVTSVGWTGGIVSIATPTVTPAFTVAGTSGGIVYFSGAATWASSGALTANLPVIGGGAGTAPTVGSRSGNTTQFVTTTGVQTSGKCVEIDANGNHIPSALGCNAATGTGDVVGPATATDNAVARYDTGTGKLIQDSAVTIDDSGNTNFGSAPYLGTLELNTFAMNGTTSGQVVVKPGAAAAGSFNFNLPTSAGTAGQVLTSGGGGANAMTWSTAGAGSVTSVATTAPLTGGAITTSGTIACATCVTSAAALTSGQLVAGAGSQATAVTNLTGDVTTSGGVATTIANNAVTTAKINNSAVTLAKLASAAASSRLVGSNATGSGSAYTEIVLGTNLSMAAGTLHAATGGQCNSVVAPGTNVIQAAINALPTTGGIVCLQTGTYTQTTGLTFGDGSTTQASTRTQIKLRGLGFSTEWNTSLPDAATIIDCTAVTSGPCIQINGPLDNWEVSNLKLAGVHGTNTIGIYVLSARFGNVHDLAIHGFDYGINSTTQATFSGAGPFAGGLGSATSDHNIYDRIHIKLPTSGAVGIAISGTQTSLNTDFNVFRAIWIQPVTNATCIYLGWADNNIFDNIECWGESLTGVTGVNFDYSAFNGGPIANWFYSIDTINFPIANTGSAPTTPIKNNYMIFSQVNGGTCPHLLNLMVLNCPVDGARVTNSASISISDSTETTLTFNTEQWDDGGIHPPSGTMGRLTAIRPGKYHYGGLVQFASNATGRRYICILKNATTYLACDTRTAINGATTDLNISATGLLAAGDYLTLVVWQNSTGALDVVSGIVHENTAEFWMTYVGQ